MIIVPAIDLMNGKCVRLREGDFDTQQVYYPDPLDAALYFQEAGFERLHLVDLDGARAGRVQHMDVLKRLVCHTDLKIDFSGGIKTDEEAEAALNAGAWKIAVGSLAVRDHQRVEAWLHRFGTDRIIIGADIRDGYIALHGWQDTSDQTARRFMGRWMEAGVLDFLCTDISRDGLLEGPSLELYQSLLETMPGIRLIASGGVTTMQDVKDLRDAGCSAAMVGKALYEGRLDPQELAAFSQSKPDVSC